MPTDASWATVLEGRRLPSAVLGGKGAALDRVIAENIAVPPTGAVTTAAYRAFVEAPAPDEMIRRIRSGQPATVDDVDAAFAAGAFAAEVADEILAVARQVADGGLLAVRSSATVEDLAGSSFAGQYRSLLEIDANDSDAVLDAVRMVFASLWHPAPVAYRLALGIDDTDAAMAAVLMRMVSARRAGVVFTTDPGGGPDMARVEAVDGLGESLVSGQRTPDAWVIPRSLDGFAGPDEVGDALRQALRIERREGRSSRRRMGVRRRDAVGRAGSPDHGRCGRVG